jgi:hypothetical protein
MELEIKNDTFFVLETSGAKSLFDSEAEAVGKLKAVVSKKPDVNIEQVNIIRVNVKGEKWEMAQIPWSKIAMELLRSGK